MPESSQTETTENDFKWFVEEAKHWISRFGLLGWRFYFSHKDNPEGGCIAWINWPENIEDRVFTIGLSKTISDEVCKITRVDIRRAAFHEVMEAFIYRLSYLARSRVAYQSEITEEGHNIIRTLENVVWEKESCLNQEQQINIKLWNTSNFKEEI